MIAVLSNSQADLPRQGLELLFCSTSDAFELSHQLIPEQHLGALVSKGADHHTGYRYAVKQRQGDILCLRPISRSRCERIEDRYAGSFEI